MEQNTQVDRAREDSVRMACLELALETYEAGKNEGEDEIVERAETYLAFINDEDGDREEA